MRIVVAMSGGVDSSVTAGLLAEQGHEVIGVHMKPHDADPEQAGHCCGLDDALDARRVADRLGVPFHVIDLREAFRKAVVQDLIDTYVAGETPNPCVQCNGVLKFRVLLARAMALGASHLATGHYARIREGRLLLARDAHKDQTYFLFPIALGALQKTLFPLGELTKSEVRVHARRFGLVTAEKAESQEICFLPDHDHARFIQREDGRDAAGEVVDQQGRALGRHDAYYRYTVGQRRGLGVSAAEPLYVHHVEPDTRRVVVAGRRHLLSPGLVADRWTWHERPSPQERVTVRIRHNGRPVEGHVGAGQAPVIRFAEPAWAVAPGQAVVVYRGEMVLGGGWIRSSLPAEVA